MKTPSRRTLAGLAAIAIGLSSPGIASAQIPGAIDTGNVVITDSDRLVVRVNDADESATQVTGTIQNTTGNTFECATPGVRGNKYPGQVTEAEIVARSMKYYSKNVFVPIGGVELDVDAPINLDPLAFGSLLDFFPTGSFNAPVGNTRSEYMKIYAVQTDARINGHTGDPRVGGETAFNVSGNTTVNWTAALGTPATGIRTDFDAGAMFYCRNTSGSPERHYVFAGYETGSAPTI
ncbi:hypothetical protein ACTHQW_11625 [Dietzia maris]